MCSRPATKACDLDGHAINMETNQCSWSPGVDIDSACSSRDDNISRICACSNGPPREGSLGQSSGSTRIEAPLLLVLVISLVTIPSHAMIQSFGSTALAAVSAAVL